MVSPKPGTYLPSGIYLHEGIDVDPSTGMINLNYKNIFHPYPSLFDKSKGYSEVTNLNPLQQSLRKIVENSLGNDWIFRQMRRHESTSYGIQLKELDTEYPLVLIYQRNSPPPEVEEPSKLDTLTEIINQTSDEMNKKVAPRYALSNIKVSWDSRKRVTKEEGSVPKEETYSNLRLILIQLYFDEKEQNIKE